MVYYRNHKPKWENNWRYLTSNVNSWYTYLQCSFILNNHNYFLLGLLIMKIELDDDINVMIMIEKIRKFSVFYVNFPNSFLNCFPNVSCFSTKYLWFVLKYINKMDWDCCLFCDEPKSWELRGTVKASSKEKADKEKKEIEETYKKTVSLIHQLAKQDLFLVEKFSWHINEQTILEIFKADNAVYYHNCISNYQQNWRDLWRKEREMMIRRKMLK